MNLNYKKIIKSLGYFVFILVASFSVTPENVEAGCLYDGSTVYWGGSTGTACSASSFSATTPSGSSRTITDSVPSYTGSITFSCNYSNAWVVSSQSCVLLVAPTSVSLNVSPLTSNSGTTVNANWSANNGPTSYTLYTNGSPGPMELATTWSGVPEPGIYSIYIRACNSAGCANSPTRTLTVTAIAPTSPYVSLSKSAVNSNEVMTISWGATGSVTNYYLNVDGSIVDMGAATFWTGKTDDAGLTAGAHNISVQACSGSLCSAFSSVRILTVTLVAPTSPVLTLSKTTVNSNEDMTISWSATGKVTNFFVDIDGTLYDMGTTTSWFGKTESIGIYSGAHNFSVKACNQTVCSSLSTVRVLTVNEVVSLDTILLSRITALTTDDLTVSWVLSGSPTRYEVKVDDTVFDLGSNTSWTGKVGDIGISNGIHTFSVRGCIGTVCSPYTSTRNLTVAEVLPTSATIVLNKSYALTVDSIDSSWSGNNYPTFFVVKVDSALYDVGESRSWSGRVENLGLGIGTHYFSVKACNSKGCSSYGPSVSLIVTSDTFTNPIPPTSVSVVVDSASVSLATDFTVTWSGNNAPTYYNIKLDSNLVGTIEFPSWTGTPKSLGLVEGVHNVSAQACNSAGCSTYSTPTLLTVTRVKKPTSAPTGGNAGTPITTTAVAQTKTGSLYLGTNLNVIRNLSITGNTVINNSLTLAGKSNCNLKTDASGSVVCASGGSSFSKSGPHLCSTIWGTTADPVICNLPVSNDSMCFLTQIFAQENKDINGSSCHLYQDNGSWKIEAWGDDYRTVTCSASCIK